uniref:Uncharacterized protein n=1 Tax=Anguilla anguilla TaxID=7936 RepID=A0A0E9QR16_ANGAN
MLPYILNGQVTHSSMGMPCSLMLKDFTFISLFEHARLHFNE